MLVEVPLSSVPSTTHSEYTLEFAANDLIVLPSMLITILRNNSSMTSSIITKPETTPCSSTTRGNMILAHTSYQSSTLRHLLSGTNTAARMGFSGFSNGSPSSICNRGGSLRQQDAPNLVTILTDDGEDADVPNFDHQFDQLVQRFVALDEHP